MIAIALVRTRRAIAPPLFRHLFFTRLLFEKFAQGI